MELRYRLTCNPWSDRGAVALADRLDEENGVVEDVTVNERDIVIRFYDEATREQIADVLTTLLQSRQDVLFIPNSLARALVSLSPGRNLKTDAYGHRALGITLNVSPEDVMRLKARNVSVKAGENKIYRLTASYPGMPGDLRGILENARMLSEQVVDEMVDEAPAKAGFCAIGDGATKHLAALTQSLQIFANKHHNAAVRGFGGGNGYFKAGAAWRYALALSATEPFHPFFEARNKGTTLLLPVVDDLAFLRDLHRYFERSGALLDISQVNVPTSATNIRELYRKDSYSGIVSLLHCIRNPLYSDRASLADDEVPRLTRWITCQFKRATYVSFGTFHIIDVNHRLFDYVKPLVFHRKGEWPIEYLLVRHVLGRMAWPETGIAERFSRALVHNSLSDMTTRVWEMYKTSDGFTFYNAKGEVATLALFNDFIDHFVEGAVETMDTELRNAAKNMGRLVGRAFPKDLTLLSKIYNIHDAMELRDAIKTVLFRLEKIGVDYSRRINVSEDEKLYPMTNKTLEILLEGAEAHCREIADVFSIFASLNAFNANVASKSEATPDISVDTEQE